jgi:hypothetical protein
LLNECNEGIKTHLSEGSVGCEGFVGG